MFLVDRKKELIIVGGYNVYPREIDELLTNHPAVREAATVGVPDSFLGEAVRSYVVLRAGEAVTVEDLSAYCHANLAKYKRPRDIVILDELPKKGPGKIDKLLLKSLTSTSRWCSPNGEAGDFVDPNENRLETVPPTLFLAEDLSREIRAVKLAWFTPPNEVVVVDTPDRLGSRPAPTVVGGKQTGPMKTVQWTGTDRPVSNIVVGLMRIKRSR